MTNKQIIRAAAERLDPATLHQIATAHHTPEEIAAVAASCKIVDKDGNEKPATAADIEIMFAADELHTFDYWKKEGKSVKKGEKALTECYLWKYTTKPSKEQREKAAAEGKEAAPDPHYYPTKSHLFSCLQVESSRPAPQARFKSTAEIIAYNKQLAAERKAAKEAATEEHGDISWWDHVTDVNYTDGQYYKTLHQPPTVHVVDFSGYDGPLEENGFPVGLPNEISEYMKQQGEPPTVPKIIFKKNEPKEDNET